MNREIESGIDFISRSNSDYIEYLYEKYQEDPRSLDHTWNAFFAGFELANGHHEVMEMKEHEIMDDPTIRTSKGVYGLVNAYRHFGHFIADLDPLGNNRKTHPFLKLSEFGLSNEDMELQVGSGGFEGPVDGTLRDLLKKLKHTYCRSMGVEFRNIPDAIQRRWLQGNMEPILNEPQLNEEERRRVLELIIAADEFEQYLHVNYLGQKRFSIEGGGALLPLLDTMIETGASYGVDDVVIGMAHRGRLNTLAHILRKPYEIILSEFEGFSAAKSGQGEGDVKYHHGYSYDHVTSKGKHVHLSLSYNPSHLELVNPAIAGIVHAKQEHRGDLARTHVVPILIHGDAAFTGQGIVTELLNLSELEGYQNGGTIHIIINNQLGFTATPKETRFTSYPTEAAKMIQAPVFHVNADDPEMVAHAAKLAIVYRERFKGAVFIELVCYRRYGHNESDDPTFTSPLMYKQIDAHDRACNIYAKKLVEAGKIKEDDSEQIRMKVRQQLDDARERSKDVNPHEKISVFGGLWEGFGYAGKDWSADTKVAHDTLIDITDKATRVPAGFALHRKLQRLMKDRIKMTKGDIPMDWGCAEMLAYGSLLTEGYAVRLTGQDCERGTFSHRHAVWHDTERDDRYVPLAHLDKEQAKFTVINSMLSEEAVLAFEYGMSLTDPKRLVIWEAQFGDFVNGSQAVVDEFITSAEAKWLRMNGLVMLLPHGYEGQGPDHSSARLERFLNLCAVNNVQICYPSTPAQHFHMFRRQMLRKFRKPLIVMSPKSLLRNKASFSPVEDLVKGSFQNVIDDKDVKPENVTHIMLCTGKVYYDILNKRNELKMDNVAILRIEQLYPFPEKELEKIFDQYPQVETVHWVQEEHQNMGAWTFMAPRLMKIMRKSQRLKYEGRLESASPATGSYQIHVYQQDQLISNAFDFAT